MQKKDKKEKSRVEVSSVKRAGLRLVRGRVACRVAAFAVCVRPLAAWPW